MLWNIALVIVYVVSLLELNAMQGPLASLNMASHIIYRYTRVRAIAFGLVSQVGARRRWRPTPGRIRGHVALRPGPLSLGGEHQV